MAESYFSSIMTVGVFAAAVVGLVAMTLDLNRLVRPKVDREEKFITYECGVDPIGGGWSQTTVRYYNLALLFVIFDVEAVFLFPWAVVYQKNGSFAFLGRG